MSDPRPPLAISSTSTLVNKTGSWKYIRPVYRDRVAPCNAGCPVGIDIEGYMNYLREGRVDEAIDLLLRENPLPATTGRVCHHPCESACNRRVMDGSVAVHAVERMLGDLAATRTFVAPPAEARSERVGVVGSGPSGIACAYHLARLGYGVTVFEAGPAPGGVLRTGIPEYRLPAGVLDLEIDRVRAHGVEFRCGVRVGTDLPWRDLERFDAVLIAAGAERSRPLGIDGEGVPGIRAGLDFLREVRREGRPRLGRRVVVVGGGNTAMDCARTALRLGAAATVLYRRSRAEMPAIAEEIAEAEHEGVEFSLLGSPVALAQRRGRIEGIECVRMRLGEPDDSGRRRPVPIEKSRFFLPADTVLTAIGEEIDTDSLPPWLDVRAGTVPVNGLGGSRRLALFAAGDLIDQPRSVADALGSGKRAAVGIDWYLRSLTGDHPTTHVDDLSLGRNGGISITRWRNDDPVRCVGATNEIVSPGDINLAHFGPVERAPDRHISARRAGRTFLEVNKGLSHRAALREAARCFNCGVCNGCEICLIFCPDIAISRRPDGGGFDIAYDYCKGCGVCSHECPRGAMTMVRQRA